MTPLSCRAGDEGPRPPGHSQGCLLIQGPESGASELAMETFYSATPWVLALLNSPRAEGLPRSRPGQGVMSWSL